MPSLILQLAPAGTKTWLRSTLLVPARHHRRVLLELDENPAITQRVRQDASDALVVAALLHDIGHLVDDCAGDADYRGVDERHEDKGDRFLRQYFDKDVTEPIRLHMSAKRYLCAVDDVYLNRLSPASIRSLELQGGPMSRVEVVAFASLPYADAAVNLRVWDDEAKQVGLGVPGLGEYIPYVQRTMMTPH